VNRDLVILLLISVLHAHTFTSAYFFPLKLS